MRCKLCSALVVSLVLGSFYEVLAQPTVGIEPTNNEVLLYWQANMGGSNGVLQSTTDLTSTNWVPVTNASPANYAAYSAVAVTPSSSMQFFRL